MAKRSSPTDSVEVKPISLEDLDSMAATVPADAAGDSSPIASAQAAERMAARPVIAGPSAPIAVRVVKVKAVTSNSDTQAQVCIPKGLQDVTGIRIGMFVQLSAYVKGEDVYIVIRKAGEV